MSKRPVLPVEEFVAKLVSALHPNLWFGRELAVEHEKISFAGRAITLGNARGISILGLGKASVEQTAALHALVRRSLGDRLELPRPFAITKTGLHSAAAEVDIVESAHPLCDRTSVLAGRALRDAVAAVPSDHVAILCLSGGGSALAVEPIPGLSLADKIAVHRELLQMGASIEPTNLIRQELSGLKNGGLLESFHGQHLVTLATVDIPSQDQGLVASGPTFHVAREARECIAHADLLLSRSNASIVRRACESENRAARQRALAVAQGRVRATLLPNGDWTSLASLTESLLVEYGVRTVHVVERALDQTLEAGIDHHLHLLDALREAPRPLALVSGGELGVHVRGHGHGGRCSAFVVAMAKALFLDRRFTSNDGTDDGTIVLGLATDGSDGNTSHAGGWLDKERLGDSRTLAVEIERALADSDTHTFLAHRGAALTTGATGTNLMDLRVIVIAD